MKLDESTRFPHPVLSRDTGDYLSGEFKVDLAVVEQPSTGLVSLEYSVLLTEPHLHAAVREGRAGVGLFVSCAESYFSDLVQLGLDPGTYIFPSGSLIGRVEMRPMIWASRAMNTFPLENCDPEFGQAPLSFPAGAILGLEDEIIINVGREKLAQMDTIFSLVEAPDLPAGTFSVLLDSDRVKILVAQDIYSTVNSLRVLPVGKPVILNSVYLPAVMEVLSSLRDGGNGYEGRRWYRVFGAKCDHLGIDIQAPELWRDAQKLLHAPFGDIARTKNILGE